MLYQTVKELSIFGPAWFNEKIKRMYLKENGQKNVCKLMVPMLAY